MKRRVFLQKTAGLVAGTALGLSGLPDSYGKPVSASKYNLVALMGGEPDTMFDMGIAELGGMESFVSKGQKVLVKPNIGWDVAPELAGNTNPLLVKRIIEHCFKAGAKEVYVFDNSCDNSVDCYKTSGIESAVKLAGGKMAPSNSEKYYQQIEIPGAVRLKTTKVHELLLETDVFINVPILKHHSSTYMTACLKNMMGMVWDRSFFHANNLNQCIADYALYHKKPVLNVVDCYNVMMKNGPRGVSKADLVQMKSQIISTDWVAADAASAKMMGIDVEKVDYIKLAHEMGVGNMNLESLEIGRIRL